MKERVNIPGEVAVDRSNTKQFEVEEPVERNSTNCILLMYNHNASPPASVIISVPEYTKPAWITLVNLQSNILID